MTEAWFRGAGRVEVRGRRGSEPGRRRRGSRADGDCSGRGYLDNRQRQAGRTDGHRRRTETVNAETELRLGLVRQSANTEVDYRTNEQTQLDTERLKYWGKLGVPNNVQVLLIKTVRRT